MYNSSFGPSILDFRLPVTFVWIPNRTAEMPDPENTGVAVEIMALCLMDREIMSRVFVPLLATYVCKNRLAIPGLKSLLSHASHSFIKNWLDRLVPFTCTAITNEQYNQVIASISRLAFALTNSALLAPHCQCSFYIFSCLQISSYEVITRKFYSLHRHE
jgi:hypothetical protein